MVQPAPPTLRTTPRNIVVPTVRHRTSRLTFDSGRGRMILLIGVSGIGKTSLVAQFPKTYWITDPLETGVSDLIDSGTVSIDPDYVHSPFDNFNGMLAFGEQILRKQAGVPDDVLTIVYESMTGMESFAHDTCCANSFGGDWGDKQGGFMNYQKGFDITAKQYWSKLLKQQAAMRQLGYNVVMTGHSDVKTMKNVVSDDYICETSNCRPETWKVTHAAFENVFFYSHDVLASKDTKHARARAKAYTRNLHVIKTPYHDAKNRCGLTKDIEVEGTPTETYMALCDACRWNPETLKYER